MNIKRINKSINGYFWKDHRAFETFKDDDIIYIPECDFINIIFFGDDFNFFDMQQVKDLKLGETFKDLKKACYDDLELMQTVFDMVDWQCFSSLSNEIEE